MNVRHAAGPEDRRRLPLTHGARSVPCGGGRDVARGDVVHYQIQPVRIQRLIGKGNVIRRGIRRRPSRSRKNGPPVSSYLVRRGTKPVMPTVPPELRQRYQQAADGEGYFFTLAKGNGYVEIVSYDKLVKDAKRRNRVLFEKLGIHKH